MDLTHKFFFLLLLGIIIIIKATFIRLQKIDCIVCTGSLDYVPYLMCACELLECN